MAVVIGLSCGKHSEGYYYLNAPYITCILRPDAVPVLIPVLPDDKAAEQVAGFIHGLILTGGGDVEPGLFGRSGAGPVRNVQPERDRTEMALLRSALRLGMPVLGICRGIQLINVGMGGDLIVDIQAEYLTSIDHDVDESVRHSVRVSSSSRISKILTLCELNVNSHHHQAIGRVAPGLVATGWAQDGIVEAVEGKGENYLIGVQWHPERMNDDASSRLFESFLDAARGYKRRRDSVGSKA